MKNHPYSAVDTVYSAKSSRDVPLTLPRRVTSSSQFTSTTCCQRQQLSYSSNHSVCSVLYSPKLSMASGSKEILQIDFQLNGSSCSCSVSSAATTENDGQNERRVHFAKGPTTTMVISSMCLQDYTPKELEACWYTRGDIKLSLHRAKRNACKRRGSRSPLLYREGDRWSA